MCSPAAPCRCMRRPASRRPWSPPRPPSTTGPEHRAAHGHRTGKSLLPVFRLCLCWIAWMMIKTIKFWYTWWLDRHHNRNWFYWQHLQIVSDSLLIFLCGWFRLCISGSAFLCSSIRSNVVFIRSSENQLQYSCWWLVDGITQGLVATQQNIPTYAYCTNSILLVRNILAVLARNAMLCLLQPEIYLDGNIKYCVWELLW